ncbi:MULTISPECIES: SUKH-4 family immunity protein [unclassified Streptomyces]|uniref:SUKH-4 family immunity protein n=1 Tax=unclassified Streptomyces TaxID=2593676 RepID=UPI0020953341|nr:MULTISPECIES: SUKH-4 family immunity protein [unclassified Streptomyces]MCO6707248.1 SUKH-4 family immunity protein [Streptomyces sp. CHA3]MCO6730950.1 SUKH-4 family immunity protein [Streptomyces sp. EL9]
MVTFAQAQERAEEWINADLPAYQHREVRVREFDLGFVVWAEDREGGPVSDGGRQRLVIARDSGDTTLWPGLPVGEVIRRYEEEYGRAEQAAEPPAPPRSNDLEQTSFLLSPPEWLQEAADKLGIPDHRAESAGTGAGTSGSSGTGAGAGAPAGPPAPQPPAEPAPPGGTPGGGTPWPAAAQVDGAAAEATPWAGTDTSEADDDRAVPAPATVFAPPLSGEDDEHTPPPGVSPEAKTALISGGSALPPTAVVPAQDIPAAPPAGAPSAPAAPPAPEPGRPVPPGAEDIADAATGKAQAAPRGPRSTGATPPPPPGPPGVPGTPAGAESQGGGAAYLPTQLASQLPESAASGTSGGPGTPPPPPGAPGTPPGGVHHAATMLAGPNPGQGGNVPQPPGPPGAPGTPPPAAPGTPPGGVHHAATMLAGPAPGPGGNVPQPPGPPGPPPQAPGAGYGYPQQPLGQPTVGPGYQAVLRYRAQDGSEQQLIRRSAPGTPHPEWQMLHELRAMGVPPQQVLELHTELESCELPGAYCARMIRETFPQARITSIAPYGRDHASRQEGMRQLLEHQGELHQVADGPARPAPVRAPLPPVPPAPQVGPDVIAQELAGALGPQGVFRFDQHAVSRQGVPDVVAHTLVWAGLPLDLGPFFWAQAQPGRPVPTLAELAQERGVQPASDAGSYLVMGSDFGKALCVQYGTAHIVAVPVEAGPGGAPVPPQFVNTGLPEFVRCLALLARMWRLRFGLNQEQAGRWTVDFQAQLAALDPAALGSPENWWSVVLEQMWDGLF